MMNEEALASSNSSFIIPRLSLPYVSRRDTSAAVRQRGASLRRGGVRPRARRVGGEVRWRDGLPALARGGRLARGRRGEPRPRSHLRGDGRRARTRLVARVPRGVGAPLPSGEDGRPRVGVRGALNGAARIFSFASAPSFYKLAARSINRRPGAPFDARVRTETYGETSD